MLTIFSFFLNARKLIFMKNVKKIHLIDGACSCNYFIKTQIVCYRKMPKNKKLTVSFPGKTMLKFKKNAKKKKSNTFHSVHSATTAGPCPILLACYCGSSTICTRNGHLMRWIPKEQADLSLHCFSR